MSASRKLLLIAVCAGLTGLCATAAQAQFGLYGAPEILPIPQVQTSYAAPQAHAASAQPVARAVNESSAATWSPWLQQTSATIPDAYTARQPEPPEPPSFLEADKFAGPRPAANPASGYPLLGPMPTSTPAAPAMPGGTQSSLISQMLEQVDGGDGAAAYPAAESYPSTGCGGFGEPGGCYSTPVAAFEGMAFSGLCGGGCCPWYASVAYLTMGRNEANRVWTTYEDGNLPNQIGHSNMASLTFEHGYEVRVGRRFGACRQWALEGVYWWLSSFNGYASITHPNGVSTPLTVGQVEFLGTGANVWYDGATEHRLWRQNDMYNIELNLIRNRLWAMDCAPWTLNWLLGVRYFRFEEGFTFGTLEGGAYWGQDGGLHEAYAEWQLENHLIGCQFGFEADYWVFSNLRVFATPKLGIYNNHITQYFNIYLGDGTIATTGSSGVPGTYPVRSSTNTVSFLGQLDLGIDWQFLPRWSLRGGYRVIAATDIGLADHQIPPYLVDIPEIAAIDTNGDLVVHGAFAGLTFNF